MKNIIGLVIIVLMLSACTHVSKQTKVKPGMDRTQVATIWGNPQKIQNHDNSCCKADNEETWYYFNTSFQKPKANRIVQLVDNKVQYALEYKDPVVARP